MFWTCACVGTCWLQVELCRKVMRLYQDMAVSWLLDRLAWEYLLSVLLHHTWHLLTAKDDTLASALANQLLKVRWWGCGHAGSN